MNPEEQQAFFERVRAKYPNWSKQKVSGYVHGVVDEARCDNPYQGMLEPGMVFKNTSYQAGYLAGFADARGEDVLDTDWWKLFGGKLEYQWWGK